MLFRSRVGDVKVADARDATPEQSFDRQWALTVLDRALKRLAQEQAAAGKAAQFARLREFLSNAAEEGYDRAAADLGLKPGTVSVAVYRLRQRYRDLVRAEVAQTVAAGDDVMRSCRTCWGFCNGAPPLLAQAGSTRISGSGSVRK